MFTCAAAIAITQIVIGPSFYFVCLVAFLHLWIHSQE